MTKPIGRMKALRKSGLAPASRDITDWRRAKGVTRHRKGRNEYWVDGEGRLIVWSGGEAAEAHAYLFRVESKEVTND